MKAIDTFTPARSGAMAVALSAINPKNLLLTRARRPRSPRPETSTADQAVALAVFVVLGTVGVAAPVAIYYLMGERAPKILAACTIGWRARTRRSWPSSA